MSKNFVSIVGHAQDDVASKEPRSVAKAMRDMSSKKIVCSMGGQEYLVTKGEFTDGWGGRHAVLTDIRKIVARKADSLKMSGMTFSDEVSKAEKDYLQDYFLTKELKRGVTVHGPSLG